MEMSPDFAKLTLGQIRNEIIRFNNDTDVQKLESYYSTKSVGEILGVSRKEVPHSNFVAWLLSTEESHNLGSYPFVKFLEILVISSQEKHTTAHKELFDSIITGDLTVHSLEVTTEKSIPKGGRIDIVVEADVSYFDNPTRLRVVIENKVGSKEHSDQTAKYYDYFEGLNEVDVVTLYVFLTPLSGIELSDLEEPECFCKEYIQTNYQALVDYLLEPILSKDISDKTRTILNEYLQSLSQPTQSEDDHKQGLIMAIGNEERELLTRFWEQNQKLIMSALYAISSDPDQEKDVRDNISTALESISGGGKDRSPVTIKFENEIYAKEIKKTDIGFNTVRLLDEKGLITDETFAFLREDKSGSFILIKSEDEVTESEIKYRRYGLKGPPALTREGVEYFACKNWGVTNIPRFAEKISKRFPQIEFVISGSGNART